MYLRRIDSLTESELSWLMVVTPLVRENKFRAEIAVCENVYETANDIFMKRVKEVELMDWFDFSAFNDEGDVTWYDAIRDDLLDIIVDYIEFIKNKKQEHFRYFLTEIFREFYGEEVTADILTRFMGKKAVCYDHYIDNGCDESENDNYVKCASFKFENTNIRVRIYYGDCTYEVGYIEVSKF